MLAVVTEKILAEGEIEDVAEFVGHFQVLFEIDAKALDAELEIGSQHAHQLIG